MGNMLKDFGFGQRTRGVQPPAQGIAEGLRRIGQSYQGDVKKRLNQALLKMASSGEQITLEKAQSIYKKLGQPFDQNAFVTITSMNRMTENEQKAKFQKGIRSYMIEREDEHSKNSGPSPTEFDRQGVLKEYWEKFGKGDVSKLKDLMEMSKIMKDKGVNYLKKSEGESIYKTKDGVIDPNAVIKGGTKPKFTDTTVYRKNADGTTSEQKMKSQATLDAITKGGVWSTVKTSAKTAKSKMDLMMEASEGNLESEKKLAKIVEFESKSAKTMSTAQTEGKMEAVKKAINIPSLVKGVQSGRVSPMMIKNTMQVPVQSMVMAQVLTDNPDFNILSMEAKKDALTKSYGKLNLRHMFMKTFVANIDAQVVSLEGKYKEIEEAGKRIGVRAFDMPLRDLKKKLIGAGEERVVDMFLMEISRETTKLAQGATESIAMLGEEEMKRWDAVHDGSLSINEIRKVLSATKELGGIRMKTFEDTLAVNWDMLNDINGIKDTGNNFSDMSDDDIMRQLNGK